MTISRRNFLKGSATVATLASLPHSLSSGEESLAVDPGPDGISFVRSANQIRIACRNGTAIVFVLQGRRLLGIGSVSLHGKTLRNPAEHIWPEIATPYGMEIVHFELGTVRKEDGAVVISTRPLYRLIHRMEWTEHAMHPLINTASWSKEPFTPEGSRFEWIVREANETYDGVNYAGFSYGFRYHSPDHPIYQIEDKATWELGGDIVGNGFIMRGGNQPHIRFKADTVLYSGWYFPGIANPNVFQHKPLYTQMQGFTFQYDADHVLLTVHERPSHVRALYQRESNQPALLHFNQLCFDLTTEITTPPRKILVGARRKDGETALVNHYLRVRDLLQEQHRKHYGLKYDKTRPGAHVETWQIVNMASFKPVFEQLKKWGVNRTFVMPLWRSTETDINPRFKQDRRRFGVFGNMCCPLELEIPECYGGWDGFREVMQQARALNLETFMWYATHYSSMTPLLQRFPDLFCRDVNGQFNRNNYGHVLMAVNQRSPKYQEYLIEHLKKAKECGLNGVFHDSHFNLATDTINFLHIDYYKEGSVPPDQAGFRKPSDLKGTDHIVSMHDTALELQRRLQNEVGLLYYVESEGALGTSMTGPDYEFVRGNEYIYSNMDADLDLAAARRLGDDPTMSYFRALSARLIYAIQINPDTFPAPEAVSPWWNPETMAPLVRAFARVEEHMDELWVLEDDRGVMWKNPQAEVVFAYKDFDHTLTAKTEVLEAVSGRTYQAEGKLPVQKMGIYLLKTA
jgi:hypothetical protein